MPRQNPPKVHIHGRSPNVTADSRGTVIRRCANGISFSRWWFHRMYTGGGPGTATRRRFSAGTASGSWESELSENRLYLLQVAGHLGIGRKKDI